MNSRVNIKKKALAYDQARKAENMDIIGIVDSGPEDDNINQTKDGNTTKIVVKDNIENKIAEVQDSVELRKSVDNKHRSPIVHTRLDQNDTERALFNPAIDTTIKKSPDHDQHTEDDIVNRRKSLD